MTALSQLLDRNNRAVPAIGHTATVFSFYYVGLRVVLQRVKSSSKAIFRSCNETYED